MAEFITIDDYDATVHREILDALVREDETVIEICEDRAIDEMRCYMSQVYDCNKIFAARGEERSQIVLMFALDIAVYHIFCIHNPHNMFQIRIDRYERAVEWLKGIQKGQIRVDGLPPAPVAEGESPSTPYLVSSNPKQHNFM